MSTAAPPTTPALRDHRGSWVPTGRMIATRIMELRKRRGLMIMLIAVNIGLPALFLLVRLIMHAVAPRTYSAAGGYDIYGHLVAGPMFIFGFIVAATLGCSAGTSDFNEGMLRHAVVTGRNRLAIYLARIPAGLAIVVPIVAAGFIVICAVCCFAAPKVLDYNGNNVPPGLSKVGFESWSEAHSMRVICEFPYNNVDTIAVNCTGFGGGVISIIKGPGGGIPVTSPPPTTAQLHALAKQIADQNFGAYHRLFLSPSNTLMIQSGLWLELEAAIGFIVGLGLSSLLGQRTVAVIIMIVLEIILTPLMSSTHVNHLINFQRAVVGLATAHLEPAALPAVFGGGGGGPGNAGSNLISESTLVVWCVIAAWLVIWSAVGAWRMSTRDV